ncbi:MAG TPA: FliM/FliN family flagellar motor C-terminal domain-containing protein [Ramlibacter sp.]|nr:FliM/FliN family flagellar motor C-terminal domain-containing protein [Ramlibacter sp.]
MATERASAPPWLPASAARRLAWWDARRLEALAAALRRCLPPWQEAWGVSGTPAAVHCKVLGRAAAPGPGALVLAKQGGGWLEYGPELAARLAGAMFAGERPPGPLAQVVGGACLDDAIRRLTSVVQLDLCPGATAGELRAASGAVLVRIEGVLALTLVLDAQATASWREPAQPPGSTPLPPLHCVADAIAPRATAVDVRIAGCALPVGALQALQVGDVLPLTHRLEDPARVRDAEGRALWSAWLGRRGGRKAVELTRLPA